MSEYELGFLSEYFSTQVFFKLNPLAKEFIPSEPSPLAPPGLDNFNIYENSIKLNQWLIDLIDNTIDDVSRFNFTVSKEKTD